MQEHKEWEAQAIALANTGTLSWRDIAEMVGKSKSTVSDRLRKYYKELDAEREESVVMKVDNKPVSHLVIPDSQVRPDVDLSFLRWIGEYIVRKQPDVIVHLGDFCDFEALSSWDKGKKSAEGKRVQADIEASILGMQTLLAPLKQLQQEQYAKGENIYFPRMVLTLGNHEDRLTRYVNDNPSMDGFLSMESLKYKEFGWEVIPFLTPINIDGVNYCHYFPNVMTGRALTGTAHNMLKTIGQSFTMGHRQTLDVATRFLPTDGSQQWGVVAGAAYTHEEAYKGVQGNHHWRGVIVKNNVKNGSYDPLFVSLDWLKSEYGNK